MLNIRCEWNVNEDSSNWKNMFNIFMILLQFWSYFTCQEQQGKRLLTHYKRIIYK